MGSPSGRSACRIPNAAVCGWAATWATSCNGALGMPDASSRAARAASLWPGRVFDHREQDLAVCDAPGIGGEPLIGRPLRMFEHHAQLSIQAVIAGGDHQPAVKGRETLIGHDLGDAGAVGPPGVSPEAP